MKKFPNVDGVVLDAGIKDRPSEELITDIKQFRPDIPVVLIRTPSSGSSRLADHELDSFDPVVLLKLLRDLNPAIARELDEQERRLNT